MKTRIHFLTAILLFASFLLVQSGRAQVSTPPTGTGTLASPYQISTLNNLYWLSQTSTAWYSGKYCIQTANIDATATSSWANKFPSIGPNTGAFYSGNYDGQGYSITNLTVNHTDYGVGLFGCFNGTLSNLNLVNASITGINHVGFVGYVGNATITRCSISGTITCTGASGSAGGMLGISEYSNLIMSKCFSSATVTVTSTGSFIGGLVGFVKLGTQQFSDCYAVGNVTGYQYVGGLIGYLATGTVTNCYSKGFITGNSGKGGLVGATAGTTNNSFWDTQTSGQATSAGGTGKTTAEMKTQSTFTSWDFSTIWNINSAYNSGYPILRAFTYFAAPTISSFTPTSAATGATVTITGTNFTGATSVSFGGTAATSFSIVDATSITAVVAGGATGSVSVTTPGGTATSAGFTYITAATWTGTTSSDWNTSTNWSPAVVPTAATNVTIPNVTNDPVVNQAPGTPAICNNLTIASGAVLTIATGKALTVNGTLTNSAGNGGLAINGSLIESTAGIAGTVNSAIPATEWHLISAPISNATSAMFTGKYLQTHSENTNAYTDITLTTDALTPVKGYAAYGDAGFTASYSGTLNTGNQTYSTAFSGGSNGWNLVGNPYPCSIDWNASSGWTKTNVNAATYCHVTGASGAANFGWATYVGSTSTNGGSQYIAPGQGFFVRSTAVGTLAMTNAVKVHNATTFFKNADEVVPNLLRIEVSGNGYKDEAVIRFAAEATAEFDGNYDAHKLYGDVAEAAQVYTLGSIPLAINSMPATSTVPLGIYTGAAGTYTLAATEINDLTGVTLEDTHTGIFTDLTKSPCSVELTAGESGQRFVLHFGPLSIEDKESTPASIYSYRHTAYISMNGNTTGDIFIYTISGQLVATLTSASGMNEVQLPVSGTYIVKVIGAKTMGVKKVFIN